MRYTLESMDPQLSGVKEWPHIVELKQSIPDSLGLLLGATVSATGMRWLRTNEGKRLSCRYFLIHSQGGGHTGEAYALFSQFHQGRSLTRLVKVAICIHQRTSYSTPEESRRGYHKGRCTNCGLDMTVDSGD
jgi:hypothetical protein